MAEATVTLITTLGSKVPVVGKFFELVDDLLTLLNNFKCNRKAAREFSAHAKEVVNLLLPELEEQMNTNNSKLLEVHFNSINAVVEEATEYFQAFTKKGFLMTLLQGSDPKRMFEEYDNALVTKVNNLNSALGIESLKLQTRTFEVVCDIGTQLDALKTQSGTGEVTLSPAAMEELSRLIDAQLEDVQEETVNSIEELLEQGPHMMIKVLSLRKFWRDCFGSNFGVNAEDLLELMLDYCSDELDNDEGALRSALTLGGDKVSVIRMKKMTRSVPEDATLLEAIRSICEQARLGPQRQFVVPPMPLPVCWSRARSAAPSVAWGANLHGNIRRMLDPRCGLDGYQQLRSWTSVHGPAGSGKTFRLLAAAHELKNEPSVSVLWVDLRGAVSESDVLNGLSLELSLGGVNKLEDVFPAFRALLLKCCGLGTTDGKPAHCTIILDHVEVASAAALGPLLSLIQEMMNQADATTACSLSVAVVSVDASPLQPHNVCASIPADSCTTLEIGPLTDAEAQHLVSISWRKAAVAAQVCNVGKNLPGKMAHLAKLDASDLDCFRRITNDASVFGSSLSSADRLCAACLFAPLRTGYVFDYALSWHLCRDAFHNDGLAWKQSMSKLLAIGWLRQKSDQGFYIPSDSMGEASSATVDPQAQWDKYYQYWADQLVKVDTMLLGREAAIALMEYNTNSFHYTLLLTTAERVTSAVATAVPANIVHPANVKACVCQLMGHLEYILVARFSPQRRTAVCQSFVAVLCDGDSSGIFTDEKLQNLTQGNLAVAKPIFLALVEYGAAFNAEVRTTEAEVVLSSALACMQRLDTIAIEEDGLSLVLARALVELAAVINRTDKFADALLLQRKALALRIAVLGGEHLLVAMSMFVIARSLYRLDRHHEALDMYKDAMCLLERLLAIEAADVALLQECFAEILGEREMGKCEDALNFHNLVLELKIRLFGEFHETVAYSLSSIGSVLSLMGNDVAALPYFQSSLELRRKLFGEKHAYVAVSLNNTANVLNSLNKHEEALSMYEESLNLTVYAFGASHTGCATTLCNIAACMRKLGRFSDALAKYEQSLAIRLHIYGGRHSDVAYVQQCMGFVLNQLERYEEALAMFQSALAVRMAVLGPGDEAVGETSNCIGDVMMKLNSAEEALEFYNQSLEVNKQLLGQDHPNTIRSLSDVVEALIVLNMPEDALEALNELLCIRFRVHGLGEHADTAAALNSTAFVLEALGKYPLALDYHQQSLAMYSKVLPDPNQHYGVADAHYGIAAALSQLGNKEEAVSAYQKAAAIYRRALGEDHESVAGTLNTIAELLSIMHKHQEALEARQQVLSICKRVHGAAAHADTAAALNSVGLELTALNKHHEALEYYEKSILISYEVLPGPDRCKANIYYNIAVAHVELGNKVEALSSFQAAFVIYQRVLGEDHESVSSTLIAIVNLLATMNRNHQALAARQEVLAIRQRVHGTASHVDTADALNQVALALQVLGRHTEALDLHQQSLAMYLEVLPDPDQHRTVADLHFNIAVACNSLGNKTEALAIYQKAVTIYRCTLGEDHEDVSSTLCTIAELLVSMYRQEEGIRYYQKVVLILQRAPSATQANVALVLTKIGEAYSEINKYDDTLSFFQRALEACHAVHGRDHAVVAVATDNVAFCLFRLGRTYESLAMLRESLAIRRRLHADNPDHPDVIASKYFISFVKCREVSTCSQIAHQLVAIIICIVVICAVS
uniref:Uncharacterized protein n=1 Tax=Spumella elongata TaxID=89044 RepID=A0A7S3H3U1_9STRA